MTDTQLATTKGAQERAMPDTQLATTKGAQEGR